MLLGFQKLRKTIGREVLSLAFQDSDFRNDLFFENVTFKLQKRSHNVI